MPNVFQKKSISKRKEHMFTMSAVEYVSLEQELINCFKRRGIEVITIEVRNGAKEYTIKVKQ